MIDLFDRILRIAQAGNETEFGADWSPLDIRKEDGYHVVLPDGGLEERRVYVYTYEYAQHGVHPDEAEETALIGEKRALAETVRKLNAQQSAYVYRADYCEVHPIVENDASLGYDFLFRCREYITLEDYLQRDESKLHLDRILYETSEAAEQERAEIAEKLLQHICLALKECHKIGAVHGHINPRNIWLAALEAEKEEFRLSFPGIGAFCRTADDDRRILDEYAAPELTNDPMQSFDEQTDLYSLGALVYQLLNEGKMPFANEVGDGTEELRMRCEGRSEIPEPCHGTPLLRYITRKLLAHSRSNRYQNAVELENDIKRKHNKADNIDLLSVVTLSNAKIKEDEEVRQRAEEQEKERLEKEAQQRKAAEEAANKKKKSTSIFSGNRTQQNQDEIIKQMYEEELKKSRLGSQPQQSAPRSGTNTGKSPAPVPVNHGRHPEPPDSGMAGGNAATVPTSHSGAHPIVVVLAILIIAALIGMVIFLFHQISQMQNPNPSSGRIKNSQEYLLESFVSENTESPTGNDPETEAPTTEIQVQASGYSSILQDSVTTTEAKPTVTPQYTFVGGKYTWEEAEAYCEQRGGHLATIHSESDWNTLLSTVKSAKNQNADLKFIWLGAISSLNDNMEVTFSWVDGSETAYIMGDEAHWYYNERIDIREPSGYDAYEYIMNGNLVREPYLLLWNIAPRGGSSSEWSLNDVPDVSDYKEYKSSNMGFVMQIDS